MKKTNFHPTYRPDIDGLRAVAILAVVSFHASPTGLRGGFVGVDVFFVISGYLISTILFRSLSQGEFSYLNFYANRIRRIFPALALVLLVCGLSGWFVLLPDEFSELGKHAAGGAGFIVNFMLWSEAGYFDTQSDLKPLMHLWSLAIEEQFYLLYPLLIRLIWPIRVARLPLLAVLMLISFGLNIRDVSREPVGTFFWPQTRFWELLAGGLLAYGQMPKSPLGMRLSGFFKRNGKRLNNLMSSFGMLLILVSALILSKGKHFPGWWAVLPVLGSLLLILAGPSAWVNRVILAHPAMVFIGLISYPLYLWHWPLLSLSRIIDSGESPLWARWLLVALSVFLAWLTWRFIERPLRFSSKSRSQVSLLCLLMLAIGLSGYTVSRQHGFPLRFKKPDYQAFGRLPGKTIGKTRPSACPAYFRDRNIPEYCSLEAGILPNVALIGDSHSAHLYSGLADQQVSVINIGRNSCVPLYNVGFGESGAECPLGYMNPLLDFALTDEHIKVIALASRFAAQVEGSGYDARMKIRPGSIKLFSANQQGNAQVFRDALRTTLQKLTGSGKIVVVILDIPELGFNPKACVRPVTWLTGRKSPCALARADFDSRTRQYRTLIDEVRKDFPSVRIFDAPALFCDQDFCWATVDGKMLYRDSDHLSLEGSNRVANQLAPFLKQLLQ